MSSRTDIVKPKIVKVHNLEEFENLLKGLKVPVCMLTESHQVVNEASVIKRLSALTLSGAKDGNCCSCCGVGPFDSREQQTAHYKHHWHTHNLKRKLYGKPALSLGIFNLKDDISSVSGSDSEVDDGKPAGDLFSAATRHCKAFFTNQKGQVFCVYRCILHHRKEVLSTDGDGTAWVERCERLAVPLFQRWAVLMVSGGHFAGAVFAGAAPVCHKTHHSYVTRRGQGQAQISRDNHGNAPRSAGASLRRYNQAQFLDHVQNILVSWAEELNGCFLILYRAVGPTNQAALFGKQSPVKRDDLRVRQLPFPTRKASYKEVQRVHDTVASIEVYDSMELFQKALVASGAKSSTKINVDATGVDRNKKGSNKPIDRAKSRERTPRELPTQVTSSEDEGPCYIDWETPNGWIKTLSEQSMKGVITDSRKDLITDCALEAPASSDSEEDQKKEIVRKKKKKKPEEQKTVKKAVPKIPANVIKLWQEISNDKVSSLEPILENWQAEQSAEEQPADEQLAAEQLAAACNTRDPADGNTALHKAAIAQKPLLVRQILQVGGDPCIRNHQLQTPYAASPHHDTRIAFRLFQGDFPDKYNYAKSHIPGPITAELLEQEKEKKAQQKRAKRQREKEKQIEKTKTNKFIILSDAEKLKQSENRCFLCASALPKTPFEYKDFKFCTIKCLQNHRNVRPLNMIT